MYRHFFKRVLDIILSLIALVFVLIVGIPIAIAIKLEDGGSIFYCGYRYGKDMKKFRMIKFRSMKMNSEDIRNEDGTTFNSATDPRMTRVGAFLRKTSLDELPQFINVLIGDMSLIGPRPSPMGNESTYDEFVMRKFRVRPGVTGLNQALLRNSATLEERYKNDVEYADNLTFAMDVKIIWLTVCSVLGKKNIYKE
ncbi:MAG: sugar transferase [Ruminococcaceae bacterium]|nr:sugar transferase [Oscillospiraceae bacterium]